MANWFKRWLFGRGGTVRLPTQAKFQDRVTARQDAAKAALGATEPKGRAEFLEAYRRSQGLLIEDQPDSFVKPARIPIDYPPIG